MWHNLLVLVLLAGPTTAAEPRFAGPPGPETEETRALFAKATKALAAGATDVTGILTDPAYLPLHERAPFRALVREHARASRVGIATAKEPGRRLKVVGTLTHADGSAAAGVLVYVYQTDARGWYSDRAPHVSGQGGDREHARLFGYLRTDAAGRFELETVRPAGYPQSDLPAHIHVEAFPEGGRPLITEICFEDDPRMTPTRRERSSREGYYVVPVRREKDGTESCKVVMALGS